MEKKKPNVRDLRNGDWLWINKLVLDHPYLTSSAKVVYSALAYFANNDTQKAYPSIDKLSKICSLNKSTVIAAIKQLEEYCFIEASKTEGKTSQYMLLKLTDSRPVGKINQCIKRKGGSEIRNGVVGNREPNNTHLTKLNNKTNSGKYLKTLKDEKATLGKKLSWPDDIRTKAQEEAGAIIRPSGAKR